MIAVKISKSFDTKIDIAIKYYMILSVLNNLKLSELDIQLMSFIAVRDNISVGGGKEEFCRIFDSTRASIYAGVYRLTKRGFLIKEGKKAKLNPAFVMDFSDDLIMQIRMNEINKGESNI